MVLMLAVLVVLVEKLSYMHLVLICSAGVRGLNKYRSARAPTTNPAPKPTLRLAGDVLVLQGCALQVARRLGLFARFWLGYCLLFHQV
jgi:hypothetical protein